MLSEIAQTILKVLPVRLVRGNNPIEKGREAEGHSSRPSITESLGVREALAWQARNPDYGDQIDKFLQITQDDDHLKLFLSAIENAMKNGKG